jgi:hypothetical protein
MVDFKDRKPPKSGWYTVLLPGRVIERHKYIKDRPCSEWPYLCPDGLKLPLWWAEKIVFEKESP